MKLHAVILAGGRGERFWPASRNQRPKQLLRLLGEETLLESTVRRVSQILPPSQIWVVAGADLRPAIEALNLPLSSERIVWEPVGRNTAAAVGAAAENILLEGEAELLVLPSDHWVSNGGSFWETVEVGRALLEGERLITFGIPPAYPETGYGYVERGPVLDESLRAWEVSRFHEKPDALKAEAYLREGRCFWNSGIFLFTAGTIASLLRRHVPTMTTALDELRADLRLGMTESAWLRYFESSPSVSLDNGVLEKAASVAVVEARFGWSDLGTWISLGDHLNLDDRGNRVSGNVLAHDSDDSILISEEGGLLAVLGVKDMIVVRVGDATLVCPKERAQEVRQLVREGRAHEVFRRFF